MYRMLREVETWSDHRQDRGQDGAQGRSEDQAPKESADEIQDCLTFQEAITTMKMMKTKKVKQAKKALSTMYTRGYHT